MNDKIKYILIVIVLIFCIRNCIAIGYYYFHNDNKDKVEEKKTENNLDLSKIREGKENKLYFITNKSTILKENGINKHKNGELKQRNRNNELEKSNDDYSSADDKLITLGESIHRINTCLQEALNSSKQNSKINTREENNNKEKIFKNKVEFFEDINNNKKTKLIPDKNEMDITNNKIKTDSLNQISTEHTQNISEYKPSFYERLFQYIPMTKFNKDDQIKMDKEIKHKNETDNNNEQSITIKPHFTRRIFGLVFDYITSLYNFIHSKVSISKDSSNENHKQLENNTSLDNEYLKVPKNV